MPDLSPLLSDYQFEPNLARAATLPARWYRAPEYWELEKERIFARTWQAVGRVEEVRRPGDFFTCDVVGEPLVVTRGTDECSAPSTTSAATAPGTWPPARATANRCNAAITAGPTVSTAG